MLRTKNWERDLAEHEVWLPNWRRHQAKAGAVRALGRGSRLRIPRRRASPMLKEQAEVKNVQYSRMINQYFLSLTEMRLWFAKCTPLSCPSGVEINIKKKRTTLVHRWQRRSANCWLGREMLALVTNWSATSSSLVTRLPTWSAKAFVRKKHQHYTNQHQQPSTTTSSSFVTK